jgi:hypothetical protein
VRTSTGAQYVRGILSVVFQKSAKTAKLIEDIRKISEQKASIDLRYCSSAKYLIKCISINDTFFVVVRSCSGFQMRFASTRA